MFSESFVCLTHDPGILLLPDTMSIPTLPCLKGNLLEVPTICAIPKINQNYHFLQEETASDQSIPQLHARTEERATYSPWLLFFLLS